MDSTEMVKNAARIAALAHAGQFRRDGVTPYVRHPESVAARVAGDSTAEAVAWLHDVLEDTNTTAEELSQQGMPTEVVHCIQLLTKRDGVSYEAYLAAVKENTIARKVKIADMLANLSDHPSDKQIIKYAKGLLYLLSATDSLKGAD